MHWANSLPFCRFSASWERGVRPWQFAADYGTGKIQKEKVTMATNTLDNIGIRRNCGTLGMRNFENSGTVLYVCNREPLTFLGTAYHVADELPFDVASTSYSLQALAELQLAWNQGWI